MVEPAEGDTRNIPDRYRICRSFACNALFPPPPGVNIGRDMYRPARSCGTAHGRARIPALEVLREVAFEN